MCRRTILLLVLLVTPLVVFGQSRIYWANEGQHEVYTVRANGEDEQLFIPSGAPKLVQVDGIHGYLYHITAHYGHGQFGTLYRTPLDAPNATETIDEVGEVWNGFALDPIDGKVYMAQPMVAPGPAPFSITRMNTDGTDWEVWLPAVTEQVGGFAIDPEERKLFLTTRNPVWRLETVNLDSGTQQDLLVGVDADGGVALDKVAKKVYWIGGTTLYRADYNGSDVEVFWTAPSGVPRDVEFDDVARKVYWGHADGSDMWIRHAPADGAVPADEIDSFSLSAELVQFAVFSDPGAAALTMPADQAVGLQTTTMLRWAPVRCSERYDLQVFADEAMTSPVFSHNTPGTFSDFVAPVAERVYYWRVGSNACGIAQHWSAIRSFMVGATGPLAAELLSPVPDGITGPDVVFEWTGAPDAVMFTLQIAKGSDFSPTEATRDGLSGYTASVEGLTPAQTYYWRVAGYDEQGRYTFTRPQMFNVAAPLTQAPELDNPENGATEVSTRPEFSWDALDGATSYVVEVSPALSFAPIHVGDTVETTSLVPEDSLFHATMYHWRVRGLNAAGAGPWSEPWSFTTAARALAAVTLTTPQDGESGVSVYPELGWEVLEGAAGYVVQLTTVADFSSLVVSDTVETTMLEVSALQPYETMFYWRVRGANESGYGPWSEVRSFTTAVGTATEPEVVFEDALESVYPNPVSREVKLVFTTATTETVEIEIVDLFGRRVAAPARAQVGPGRHSISSRVENLASGLYLLRISFGEAAESTSFVVAR